MLKDDIIIHISDIHVSDQSGTYGYINKKTYLTTDCNNLNYDYITKFVDKIKSIGYEKIYLVLTGDIANIAEEDEYREAIKLIKQLMQNLSLDKNNVLIIPGDHDVHRDTIKNKLRNKQDKEIPEAKFGNFNQLYKAIKESDFDHEKLIFDKIVLQDIVLLGVNSNSKVNQNGGHGFLPSEEFELELTMIKDQFANCELIPCLHHNLEGSHEDTHFGQWVPENKKNLVAIFERHDIKCILNGNEHTPNSKNIIGSDIIISDSGAFSAKDDVEASFKVYTIKRDNGLILKNDVYGLRKINTTAESNFGNWVLYSSEDIKSDELESFILRNQNIQKGSIVEIPFQEELPDVLDTQNDSYQEIKIYENTIVQNRLYQIIKDKKLFHQGHFHWSETSRAHNWIDIARLLEKEEDLYFIQNAIIDVLEKLFLTQDADLIIGLGYEGNIISGKVSIKFEVPYTFLPYSYRWEDHHEFENKLNFDNSNKEYKKVILITDVVNDGRTIRKLIGKEDREKAFFDNVEKIIVVSLFYTGHQSVNYNILNYDFLPEDFKRNDEIVNNIEFYTIQQLKVEKCPYGENYKSECFILKDKLQHVYKFYSEKE